MVKLIDKTDGVRAIKTKPAKVRCMNCKHYLADGECMSTARDSWHPIKGQIMDYGDCMIINMNGDCSKFEAK
jgi:hypothetical protein